MTKIVDELTEQCIYVANPLFLKYLLPTRNYLDSLLESSEFAPWELILSSRSFADQELKGTPRFSKAELFELGMQIRSWLLGATPLPGIGEPVIGSKHLSIGGVAQVSVLDGSRDEAPNVPVSPDNLHFYYSLDKPTFFRFPIGIDKNEVKECNKIYRFEVAFENLLEMGILIPANTKGLYILHIDYIKKFNIPTGFKGVLELGIANAAVITDRAIENIPPLNHRIHVELSLIR